MRKSSNSIIIGGPVAVGKSVVVGSLPLVPVQELESNDELQSILIERMYEGDKIAPQIFQLDMLLTRFDKYKKLANNKNAHVFDRSIFEDIFFAKKLLFKDKNIWEYYYSIWKDKVEELINEVGKPKLYILLTLSWDTFKQRVFDRNRTAETSNFDKNKTYFKEMVNEYEEFAIGIFKEYNLEYVVINTDNKDKLEVITEVKNILSKRGII